MSFTFIKAQGGSIGDSICEDDKQELALEILQLAKEKNVKYLDLTYLNNECTYIDGNHLDSASSLKISKLLNQLIQQ